MDTKKTKRVKLRGGPIITVSQQIFNWRAKRKAISTKTQLQESTTKLNTLYNAPGCPINDEPSSLKVTPNWDIFK